MKANRMGPLKGVGKEVTAECLCIGDELLIGQTLDTNSAWMGQELGLSGIRPIRTRVVGDNVEAILDALATVRADIVLMTGGLGPTKDDITKRCLCEFFDTRLVRNADAEARVISLFTRMGRQAHEVKPADLAQAFQPESCTVLPNELGTASGMWFERDGRVYVSMPGVPYEMKGIMENTVLPKLREMFNPPTIVHRTLQTTGMGETLLAEHLEEWENNLAEEGIHLAYLPSPGLVKLRLSTYAGADPTEAMERVDRQVKLLYGLIPELIFGEGRQHLEEVIGAQLKELGQTLALAESCTGGYLSHL
ncbi:MAG: molybdopterin-binding protein, partial [Flavobacteriales bacterium]